MKEDNIDVHEIAKAEITASIYSVLFANDAASCVAFDFYEMIRKSSLYKYKVKMLVHQIEKERLAYESRISNIVKSSITFLADVSDVMQDIVSNDVLKMEITIGNYLKKYNVKQSDIIAKLETLRIITGFACHNVMNQSKYLASLKIKDENGKYLDTIRMYNGMVLTRMFSLIENLSGMLYAMEHKNVDINACKDIGNGFRIIMKKLSDISTISLAIKTAQNIEDGIVDNVSQQKSKDEIDDFYSKISELKEHFNSK